MLDNVDKCPDTPPGVAVDAYGCTRKGSITLEGVTFEYNSARLEAGVTQCPRYCRHGS